MTLIGMVAVGLFVTSWLGAAVSFFALDLRSAFVRTEGRIWGDADARRRFLIVLGFCALGPLSALLGFAFGCWPTN